MPVNMKQMIAETLAGLLKHKSIDKITVRELVDACGICRQAFYYHFQDLMDVVEWLTAQALQRAVDEGLAAPTPQEALTSMILSMRENKSLIHHLLASQRRQEIERLLVRSTRLYLEKLFRAKAENLMIRPDDLETAIRFHSYGLVGLLIENLDTAKDVSVLSGQFYGLITGQLWDSSRHS